MQSLKQRGLCHSPNTIFLTQQSKLLDEMTDLDNDDKTWAWWQNKESQVFALSKSGISVDDVIGYADP